MERLLLAIKVRWYCNIGKGPVHTTDGEIAMAFDQLHGGIMKAISSGLFQYFFKQNDVNAEKEFATLRIEVDGPPGGLGRYILKEVGKPGPEREASGVPAALNGLHLKGYTHYEKQIKTTKNTYTFSRRKHDIAMSSGVTDILISNTDEIVDQERNGYIKQFATVLTREYENISSRMIGAPAEFDEDESRRSDPLNTAVLLDGGPCTWLESNGFVTREDAYEDIFREYIESSLFDNMTACMFSRLISKSRDDTSW